MKNPASIATDSNPVIIGAQNRTVFDFNGLIDEVRIYNYTRTADQVKQDYNEGAAVHLGE